MWSWESESGIELTGNRVYRIRTSKVAQRMFANVHGLPYGSGHTPLILSDTDTNDQNDVGCDL